jgi:hypothetical protein
MESFGWSVRLRDGTLVLSGTEQGTQAVVQHVDQHKLHTIAADLVMLEQHALIQRDEERHGQKTIVVATLTRLGLDVANGRPHPIVDQPSPKF